MTQVEIGENGFVVEAEILAEAFGIKAADVQPRMQSGALTSRCEQGVDEDAGRQLRACNLRPGLSAIRHHRLREL